MGFRPLRRGKRILQGVWEMIEQPSRGDVMPYSVECDVAVVSFVLRVGEAIACLAGSRSQHGSDFGTGGTPDGNSPSCDALKST